MGLVVLPSFYAILSKRLSRFITAVPEFCLFSFVNGLFNIEKDIFLVSWGRRGSQLCRIYGRSVLRIQNIELCHFSINIGGWSSQVPRLCLHRLLAALAALYFTPPGDFYLSIHPFINPLIALIRCKIRLRRRYLNHLDVFLLL